MGQKILICGGLGYLGSIITDLLIKKKNDVDVYDICLWDNKCVRKDIGHRNFYKKVEPVGYDVVVWCATVDNLDFWNSKSKFVENYKNKTLEFIKKIDCSKIFYCVPPFVDNMDVYKEIATIFDLKKTCFIKFPSLYGPSPRMRWDMIPNKFLFDFLTTNATILEEPLKRIPICSVLDAAKFVIFQIEALNAMNYITQSFHVHFATEYYSSIEMATIIKNLMPNPENYQIHCNKVEEIPKEAYEYVFVNPTETLEKSMKEMLNQLEKNFFPDFTHDRYNNEESVSKILAGLRLLEGLDNG
jgi:nucleoside-diphosphate-sugar epimerase